MGEPETAIRVENLSKRYVISHAAERGRYSTLRDTIAHGAKSLVRQFIGRGEPVANPTREEFWALKDVSFEVKRGDVVGIIGRNGAGKSTLLKILSRITEPTTGRIAIDGRVASLLEVGTGFHPELTGRENVYLNGSILGMTRAEVKRKFDEIVAFAEIEKFLDTPVKRYSSGMYMRLAFAVAAHLEPEILIVDEVLAVGDAGFQKKCLGKMGEVAKGGRTVLFVSHNMEAISALCEKCILLDRGLLRTSGATNDCIREYTNYMGSSYALVRQESHRLKWMGIQNLTDLRELSAADDVIIQLGFRTGASESLKLMVDIGLSNQRSEQIIHARGAFVSDPFEVGRDEQFTIEYRFQSPHLAPGSYTLSVYAYTEGGVEFWADKIECLSVCTKPYFGRSLMFDGLTTAIVPEFEIRLVGQETDSESQHVESR